MDAKHTPGPWEMAEAGRWKDGVRTATEYFVRRPEDDVAIASDIIDPANNDTPSEANARLIAAAPDLLAALKESLHDNDCHPPEGRHSERCQRARAAIAKAEGGQQ